MKNYIKFLFLLFCLLGPIAINFTWLHFQKKQIRKEVKWKMIAGLDRDELFLLKFSKAQSLSQLKWKHSKEFEFNHQMYDVVDRLVKGDTISYWCWWDYEETNLNKKLKALVAFAFGHDTKSENTQKQLFIFFKSLYCNEGFEWTSIVCKTAQKMTPYLVNYRNLYYPPEISPPKIS